MMCAWKELLALLPPWLRREVDTMGKESLREIRLRANSPPELVLNGKSCWLTRNVTREDLNFPINAASGYSPWAATTIGKGFLTAPGGHRIGLCGEGVIKNGEMTVLREVSSLCIRVARDYSGIARGLHMTENILILGAPGWGKTTLLRDLTRQLAEQETVAVVDERGELFPEGIPRGKRMDVLTGCPKAEGIAMVLRAMSPQWIAVDEITAVKDCESLIGAIGCGVRLAATAHGASVEEFRSRPVYRRLWELGIFQTIVVLNKEQSFRTERVAQWN